ncbi:MAG TPA: cytochrome c3 family protein [Blastocatellia bacterium]|nr:cytochrome c3 family protein [Blastocatellia bacterium]
MRARRLLLIGFFCCVLGEVVHSQSSKAQLFNSKHDFRVNSSAAIRSTAEGRICVFCHSPHNGNPSPQIWNHKTSSVSNYPLYGSTTMRATTTQPTSSDSSKLCLSCHDGTVALGDTVNNGLIPFIQGSNFTLPASSSSNLHKGVGFSDDHPFAFLPVTGSEIRNPPAGDAVKLDRSGKMQCTSCHDPHVQSKDATVGKFLVESNLKSALCTTCHTKTGWTAASHKQPASGANDNRYGTSQGAHTGYTGVSNNGCESCHRPHSPAVGQRLLKFVEEDTCYKCHNGSVADTNKNIQSEFQTKTYRHPVSTTPSVHDASEGPASLTYKLPESSSGAARHAECADCHDPHAANPQTGSPPSVAGYLREVAGISSSGTEASSANYEYEVCFKCHADSANKPQLLGGVSFGRNPLRQTDDNNPSRFNSRFEFNSSVAWHPVINPRGLSTGTSGFVPSLRSAPLGTNGQPLPGRSLSASSFIYCTDCHNNSSGRNLGTGTGPSGPHGSNIIHLLERNYSYNTPPANPGGTMGQVTYSTAAYALCNKCHDVDGSIVQNRSFKEHDKHIRGEGASCSVCHDSHGINGGNATNNKFLINFDLSIVGPDSSGRLRYESTGFRRGSCYLTCHGEEHNPKTYSQ